MTSRQPSAVLEAALALDDALTNLEAAWAEVAESERPAGHYPGGLLVDPVALDRLDRAAARTRLAWFGFILATLTVTAGSVGSVAPATPVDRAEPGPTRRRPDRNSASPHAPPVDLRGIEGAPRAVHASTATLGTDRNPEGQAA